MLQCLAACHSASKCVAASCSVLQRLVVSCRYGLEALSYYFLSLHVAAHCSVTHETLRMKHTMSIKGYTMSIKVQNTNQHKSESFTNVSSLLNGLYRMCTKSTHMYTMSMKMCTVSSRGTH